MPKTDEQLAATPEAPEASAPPPPAGTGKRSYGSFSELANANPDFPEESAPPAEPASGEPEPEDGSDEAPEGQPPDGETPSEDSKDSAQGDGLEEVEVVPGVKMRVSPADARVIRAERKAEDEKRLRLEGELEHRRKEAGRAKREKAPAPEGEAEAKPTGPPPIDRLALARQSFAAFQRFDTSDKPEDLAAALDAYAPAIVAPLRDDLANLRAAMIEMIDISNAQQAEIAEFQRKFGPIAGEVAPSVERRNVINFAKGQEAFASLPDEAITKAYSAAKAEWEADIADIGVEVESPQAQRIRERVLARHLAAEADTAMRQGPAAPSKAKGDLSARRASVPGPKSPPAPASSPVIAYGSPGGLAGLARQKQAAGAR